MMVWKFHFKSKYIILRNVSVTRISPGIFQFALHNSYNNINAQISLAFYIHPPAIRSQAPTKSSLSYVWEFMGATHPHQNPEGKSVSHVNLRSFVPVCYWSIPLEGGLTSGNADSLCSLKLQNILSAKISLSHIQDSGLRCPTEPCCVPSKNGENAFLQLSGILKLVFT